MAIVVVATLPILLVYPFAQRFFTKGVLTGATPGAPYYLNSGGGLTPTQPSGSSLRLVRIGWAVNSTDLDVVLHDMGKRSA